MSERGMFFEAEHELRHQAMLARNLAAIAHDAGERDALLREAASYSDRLPSSFNERLLIRR